MSHALQPLDRTGLPNGRERDQVGDRERAGDVLSGIAQAITAGVRWIVTNTATWWLRIPSPNLAGEPAVDRASSSGCCRSPSRWRSAG